MINLIEGGKHTVSGVDFQEFLVVPKGVKYVAEGYAKTLRLIDSLKGVIKQKKLGGKFGLEGGFAPNSMGNESAISLLEDAREKIEFTDKDFDLGLDIAATSLYKNGEYQIHDVRAPLNREGVINFLRQLSKKHKLISLEDPLHENDRDGWSQLTKRLSPRVLIIGDDLTATNHNRLSVAIEKGAVTGVVVKPDQIGTVTEALSFALRAREAGVKTVFSHRGGETEDTSIADLATALNADYIKIGSPLQKERFAKYARLMRIEKELWEERL
jgi:enolase